MNGVRCVAAFCGWAFFAGPLAAANLAQVDRTIAKEPEYQSTPNYCLLVFGPEAKSRIWLVDDGDVLSGGLDRLQLGRRGGCGVRLGRRDGHVGEVDGAFHGGHSFTSRSR